MRSLTPAHSDIVAAVKKYLHAYGLTYSETDASRALGPDGKIRRPKVTRKGWPDLTVVVPRILRVGDGDAVFGQCCGIEVKTAKDKQSPEQVQIQTEFESNGALYILAYSVDDVHNALKDFIREARLYRHKQHMLKQWRKNGQTRESENV